MVAMAGGLTDGLARVGVGAGAEQHPGDVGVVDFHRSPQGRPVAGAASVVGVRAGAGVEQDADHLGHPGRPVRVDLMPPGVAGVQQGRPAAFVVDGHRGSGVGGEHLTYRLGVAEHGRGEQAAAGDARICTEDVAGLPQTALDRGGHERGHLSTGDRVGVDGGFEPGPAREAQLASDDQLGGSQTDRVLACRWMMAGEPLPSCGIPPSGRVAQFFGPAAQLVEIRALGK